MDTEKNNVHRSKEESCEICGNILTKGMCSNCGWVQIIFPSVVPPEITDFNTLRKETAKKLYKEVCSSKITIEKLEKDYNYEVSKNKTLKQNLNESKKETQSAQKEKEHYKIQWDNASKSLAALQKEYHSLADKVQNLTSQKESLTLERDRANDNLSKEREENRITKNALNVEKNAHNRTKELLKEAMEKPITQNSGVVIGKVLFHFNEHTEAKELYKGLCRVKAPSWTNISGDLFEINGDKGVYCIWDLNGNMRDRRGRTVPPQGVTTRNNDVFTIGGLTIKFTLPEIDYDSLY